VFYNGIIRIAVQRYLMRLNFAHLRERSTSGGWINFAVFEADATSNSNQGRSKLLSQLTVKARLNGLRVDKAALAFAEGGQVKYFGSPDLVDYLAKRGVPRWTHTLDV
jgi:hypothetical protein